MIVEFRMADLRVVNVLGGQNGRQQDGSPSLSRFHQDMIIGVLG
jgi:hypothetical protein